MCLTNVANYHMSHIKIAKTRIGIVTPSPSSCQHFLLSFYCLNVSICWRLPPPPVICWHNVNKWNPPSKYQEGKWRKEHAKVFVLIPYFSFHIIDTDTPLLVIRPHLSDGLIPCDRGDDGPWELGVPKLMRAHNFSYKKGTFRPSVKVDLFVDCQWKVTSSLIQTTIRGDIKLFKWS